MAILDKLPEEVKQSFTIYDYENMLLGAILSAVTDGEELAGITKDWFVQQEAKLVFDAVKKSKEQTGYCDYIAVRSEIDKDLGSLKSKQLLDRMMNHVPADYNPRSAVDKLEEYYIRRQANSLLELVREGINSNANNASDLFQSASEKLDKLINTDIEFNLEKEFTTTINGLIDGTGDQLVIKTGFDFYDKSVGGIPTQEITIIGARPSHGKTTTAIGLSLGILDTNPEKRVALFQLEMGKESIKHKYISNKGRISSEKMRLGLLDDEDKEKLRASVELMKQYSDRLFIFDDVYDLTSMLKIVKAKKIDVAFVDYIQLMDEMQNDDVRRSLGRTLVRAKRHTKRANMAFVFYSQLNRAVESRDTKIPETGDLAESDLIGHIASDVVLLSYRYKYTKEPQLKNLLMWYFDKARYASVTNKGSGFNPDNNALYDLAPMQSTLAQRMNSPEPKVKMPSRGMINKILNTD